MSVLGRLAVLLLVLPFGAVQAQAVQDIEDIWSALREIKLDSTRVLSVRGLTLRRDVFSISLNRGTLVFAQPVRGKVTGAVFIGRGEILALPQDRTERQQLYRFTKSAILNESFESLILRFTDETYTEILKQLESRASEDPEAEEVREIMRWESELQRRSRFLNDRILADLLASSPLPFFLAQVEGNELGWFDAVYDQRRVEEVMLEQSFGAGTPVVWMSFHKAADTQKRDSGDADKEVDLVAYRHEGAVSNVRFATRRDGERVVQLPVPPAGEVLSVSSSGQDLKFFSTPTHVAVLLPEASKSGQELEVTLTYAESTLPLLPFSNRQDWVAPRSYRDQWIMEALRNYGSAVSGDALEAARQRLLASSPENGTYESLGPVTLGYRLMQPRSTENYPTLLRDKSVWILHMLRMLMRRSEEDEEPFRAMLEDFTQTFSGRSISTAEFQALAERHAGLKLDWFFDQWVHATGVPAYSIQYQVAPANGGFAVSGTITQTGVPASFTMPVPLYADDVLLGRVTVSDEESSFRFLVRNRPQTVSLDPKRTILTANTP